MERNKCRCSEDRAALSVFIDKSPATVSLLVVKSEVECVAIHVFLLDRILCIDEIFKVDPAEEIIIRAEIMKLADQESPVSVADLCSIARVFD